MHGYLLYTLSVVMSNLRQSIKLADLVFCYMGMVISHWKQTILMLFYMKVMYLIKNLDKSTDNKIYFISYPLVFLI